MQVLGEEVQFIPQHYYVAQHQSFVQISKCLWVEGPKCLLRVHTETSVSMFLE